MRNKWMLFAVLLAIAGFAIYAAFIKKVYTKEIHIPEPFTKIGPQLSDVKNIAKWYMPFASNDTGSFKFTKGNKVVMGNTSLTLSKIDVGGNWYEITEQNDKQPIVFSLYADTGRTSKVVLQYENTLLGEWTRKNNIINNARQSLENLKDYFAESKKMYGYTIEVTRVTDTAFLFTSQIVSNTNKKETLKMLYEKLIQTAKEKNNGYNGTRVFYSSPFGKDSIHLFVGIGITQTENINMAGEVTLKRMPYNMNLLVTFYQGSFNKISTAINALEQFKADNNLVSVAIPFVKFITEGTDFSDEQVIQATACYPIF